MPSSLLPAQSLTVSTNNTVTELENATVASDRVVYLYNGSDLVLESEDMAGEGRIYHNLNSDGTVSKNYHYFFKDHLGSTRMVMNQDGDIVEALMYEPYGAVYDVPGLLRLRLIP